MQPMAMCTRVLSGGTMIQIFLSQRRIKLFGPSEHSREFEHHSFKGSHRKHGGHQYNLLFMT